MKDVYYRAISKIYFATTNQGKLHSLQKHFKNVNVDIEQCELDIIEPQADTVEEIAMSKALQAYKKLKKPVLVEDGGFIVDELNGFPGPYIKFVLKTLGIEYLMQFSKTLKSRECRFVDSAVYIGALGVPHVFNARAYTGKFATKINQRNDKKAWSDLWRIFIPTGATRELIELTEDERVKVNLYQNHASTLEEFSKWYKSSNS